MEKEKKGIFKRITEIFKNVGEAIKSIDIDEVTENGDINDDAFKDVDPKVLKELKKQSKESTEWGTTMFADTATKRKHKVSELTAEVNETQAIEATKKKSAKTVENNREIAE